MNKADQRNSILLNLLVVAASLPFLIPFAWLVSTAFKTKEEIFTLGVDLIPNPVTFEHFYRVLTEFPFFMYLGNTLIVTSGTVVGALCGSIPVAYSLSCLEWPDRKFVFTLLMMTMMLPAQVTLIPLFLLYKQLGWLDTFLPLIVPFFLGNAFFIFLLRQFFLSFPRSLIESARIDGASEPRILLAVIVPLCKPAILTVTLFAGIGAWNDFVGPLIFIASEEKKTLALGLQTLIGKYGGEWGMLMAAALMMAAPVITLFFFAQRQFIQGITLTGLKG